MNKLLLFLVAMLFAASSGWGQTTRLVPSVYATIQAAIDGSAAGDIIQVQTGTLSLASEVFVNKANLTIQGVSNTSTKIQVSGTGYRFNISASGVTIQNLEIEKTDKTGTQDIIYIGANNATIKNNIIHGQFVIGDGDVSRAMVVAGSLTGLSINGNTFYALRQPGYFSGPTTGVISNNYTYGTKGWVMEGGDMTFTGNTWGVNVYDIVILNQPQNIGYYLDIIAMSNANNDAVIEDQRVSPAVLSVAHVVAGTSYSGDMGGTYHPYLSINSAIERVVAGGKIKVAAGTYNEEVTIDKSVKLYGAGYSTTTIVGPYNAGTSNTVSLSANNILLDGFTITRNGNNTASWNSNVKSQGIHMGSTTGSTIQNCRITETRTGIYFNNCQGNTVKNNIITNNRTGIQLVNNVSDNLIEWNQVTDNWTVGFVIYYAGETTPTTNFIARKNVISGNWYSQVDCKTNSSNPTIIYNFEGNYYGTVGLNVVITPAGEPGYSVQIPVVYGGTATSPGAATGKISGDLVALVDYTPWCNSDFTDCSWGPITTSIGTLPSSCGTLDVPVTVKGFKNVGTISLILNYDKAIFEYQGVTLTSPLSASDANGGIAGKFILGWYSVTGMTLAEDAVLFTLHFKLLPAAISGATTNLTWSTVQGDCEYAAPGGDPVYNGTFTDKTWSIPTRPVRNTTTLREYCTIQAAINDAATVANHILTVDAALYTAKEQVMVNKEVTIKGINGQPTVDFLGTVNGKPTLFDISANNVTIDNIHFNVDLSKLRSAIIASGAGLDNIVITNNLIDAYGTAAGSYGDRNAVSINYSGPTNYRFAEGGVNSITFTGNIVNGAISSFFRSGVAVDEGGGTFSGNTLKTGSHDIILRFGSNGAVNITGNNLNGGGIELADQNAAAGTFTVSTNIFTAGFNDPNVALLRIKNNYNSIPHVVLSNTFNYNEWALSLENMNGITLNANTFLSTSYTAHAVVVNTKSITGNSSDIVQVPIGAIFTNNNFNGTGTALTFQNHDSDNDSYGTIIIGTAGNENNFAATLNSFITLDGQTGSSDLSTTFPNYPAIIGTGGQKTTTMACWDQNLNAQNNNFNVGAGLQLPTAMNFAGRTTLESKLTHKPDNDCLGYITYFYPVHNLTMNTYFMTIQSAITAAAINNVIECAEWTFNERVTIDKSLTLQGVNEANCIITGIGLVGDGNGITINNGVTGVTIKYLTVQNFQGASGNANGGIYAIGDNNNLTLQHVTLQDNRGATTSGSGFYANGPIDNVLLDDVTSTGHYPGARGIVIWNGLKSNITITNCKVFNNNCCGIELQDGTASGVLMENNQVYDNGDNGFGLSGLQGPGENLIKGNTVTNNGRFGIEIKNPNGSGQASGAGRVVVENNTVSRTVAIIDARDIAGIAAFRRGVLAGSVDVPTGVVIQNNTVSGYVQASTSDGFGIVVEGTNHTVSGNTVSGNDVGIQQQVNPSNYPGDADQSNLADQYFGRGNSPMTCGITMSGNIFSSNGIDTRNVGATGGVGFVVNTTTGKTFCSIQAAIDDGATVTGNTLQVSAGTFNENVVLNKSVTVLGAGPLNTILTPLTACSGTGVSITAAGAKLWNLKVTNYSNGVAVSNTGIEIKDVESVSNCNAGLELSAGTGNLSVLNSKLNNNNVMGFRKGTAPAISGFLMDNCEVKGNLAQGCFIATTSGAGVGTFDNVNIRNSTISNNKLKGLYFEALSNALLKNLAMDNNGTDVTYNNNNGIDINLKYHDFVNITISDCDITNSGYTGTATDPQNPAAIAIKARDDASSYNTFPATLNNVLIKNNKITGPQNGIRIGEYGKTNATPTNVTIEGNDLSYAFANKALISRINSDINVICNWHGSADLATISGTFTKEGSGNIVLSSVLNIGGDLLPAVGFQPSGTCVSPIVLTCPAPANEAACQTQATINSKFATWLGTIVASGGCNSVLSNNNTGAPSACGGSTTVTWTYSSTCAPLLSTCSATFNVAAPAAIVLTCPAPANEAACQSQATIDSKFAAWLGTVVSSGGCDLTVTNQAIGYVLGNLDGQNGWNGGIGGFTNYNSGDADVVNNVAQNGSQSWYFKRGYNSPGQGSPFSPVVASVGALDKGAAGNQSIIQLSFKPATQDDGSRITVYEGSVNRDDRTGANLYIQNIPGGLVQLYMYRSDNDGPSNDYSAQEIIGTYPANVWNTVKMVTDYPTTNVGDRTAWGTTKYYVNGSPLPVFTETSWTHWWRENHSYAYAPGSSIKFTNNNAGNGFYIDDVSMIVNNTITNKMVGRFSTGFEVSQPINGGPSACGGEVTVKWTAKSSCEADKTCEATFSVAAPATVVLTSPSPANEAACQSQATINSKFAAWLGTVVATGGCNGSLSTVPATPVAPSEGGSVTVEWTYTSSCMPFVSKSSSTFTVAAKNTISGTLKYYNTTETALNNVVIDLKQGGTVIQTYTTLANGSYIFNNVCPGTYDVTFTTGKDVGGINSTDAGAVNGWQVSGNGFPLVYPSIERVRFNAGDVSGDNNVVSQDAALIQAYFINDSKPPFDPLWKFWKAGESVTTQNPQPTTIQIVVPQTSGPITQNFYGLVNGDFNRSFTPGALKSAPSATLSLIDGQSIPVVPDTIFNLPVKAGSGMKVGAISLILNFPNEKLQVEGVYLRDNPGLPVMYKVSQGELLIGWNSLNALSLAAGETLLTVRLKTASTLAYGEMIRFSLAGNPLNELADDVFEVIPDAKLKMDVMKWSTVGINNPDFTDDMLLTNYPNPFSGATNIEYTIPEDGHVNLEITSILGNKLVVLSSQQQTAGKHYMNFDGEAFPPGIYLLSLRLEKQSGVLKKTIRMIVSH